MFGNFLAVVSTLGVLTFALFHIAAPGTNPYVDIVGYLMIPSVLVLGLLIIPVGVFIKSWRIHRRYPEEHLAFRFPKIDFNDPEQRKAAKVVVGGTFVLLPLVGVSSYHGYDYTDSAGFCAKACHEVMEPPATTYEHSAHARVSCAECHIGSGASWFVKSKLSGLRQVYAVTFHTYAMPIPTPVTSLRPARDTCEQCHWPEKFHGDIINVVREFASDERNLETTTTLQVHVGGGGTGPGGPTGIHWHVNPGNRIEFVATDAKRQVIPWVKLTDPQGNERVYETEGVSAADLARGEPRTMDCIDCHNRPTHPFAGSAEREIDRAIGFGEIPKTLPFVKREAVTLVKSAYPSQEAATAAIADLLGQFYRTNYPEILNTRRAEVDQAIRGTQRVYQRNVFPTMRVTWGTHPNNIGHMDFPGCFRCHDDTHKTKDGQTIRQDCELCHKMQQ